MDIPTSALIFPVVIPIPLAKDSLTLVSSGKISGPLITNSSFWNIGVLYFQTCIPKHNPVLEFSSYIKLDISPYVVTLIDPLYLALYEILILHKNLSTFNTEILSSEYFSVGQCHIRPPQVRNGQESTSRYGPPYSLCYMPSSKQTFTPSYQASNSM